MKKKALIIENDGFVEKEVLGYVNDNPDLFDEVIEFTYARNRSMEFVHMLSLGGITDILGQSTFMYTDQLEQLVGVIYAKHLDIRLHFVWAVQKLNSFISTRKDGSLERKSQFNNLVMMNAMILSWVKAGLVYEITNYSDIEVPADEFQDRFDKGDTRHKIISKKVMYNEEFNIFYKEGETVTQESAKYVHGFSIS